MAMKQNVYDDPEFFAGYKALRDNDSGLNGTLEEPAVLGLLPDLEGSSVLDLGSGFGDFCRLARSRGAASVCGVEISRRMLETARERTDDAGIEYVHAAIEDFDIPPSSYDLVVSRMALHYVRDYAAIVRTVNAGLRPGGRFVFSVEHPICTALCRSWHEDAQGDALFWPVDDYGREDERLQRWFVDGVVKYHRTVQTYVNALLDAGLILTRLLEPQAEPEWIERRPDLQTTVRRPPILVIAADKTTDG
ncbi:MAG: class I SAM-dependent methyltransferase [Acidihalobacter sp.]|uniref:class I SAM-dependent methyltransferase n=1 Tax=Acidihalobacter sp. TaxID=1872108 RepID=UPI00307D55BC